MSTAFSSPRRSASGHEPQPLTGELRIRLEGRAELLEEAVALGAAILALSEDDWCWELPARQALFSRQVEVMAEVHALEPLEVLAPLRSAAAASEARVMAWALERWSELPPGAPPAPASLRARLEGLVEHAPLEQGRAVSRSDGPGALALLAVAVLAIAGLTTAAVLGALALGLLAVASFLRPRRVERWWLLEHTLVLEGGTGANRRVPLAAVQRVERLGGEVAFWGEDPRAPLARVRCERWLGLIGLYSVLRSPLNGSPRQRLARLSLVGRGERPTPSGGAPQLGTFVADEARALWIPDGVVEVDALEALELPEPRPRLAEAARELLARGLETRQAVVDRLAATPGVLALRLPHAQVHRAGSQWALDCREVQLVLALDAAEGRQLESACAGRRGSTQPGSRDEARRA